MSSIGQIISASSASRNAFIAGVVVTGLGLAAITVGIAVTAALWPIGLALLLTMGTAGSLTVIVGCTLIALAFQHGKNKLKEKEKTKEDVLLHEQREKYELPEVDKSNPNERSIIDELKQTHKDDVCLGALKKCWELTPKRRAAILGHKCDTHNDKPITFLIADCENDAIIMEMLNLLESLDDGDRIAVIMQHQHNDRCNLAMAIMWQCGIAQKKMVEILKTLKKNAGKSSYGDTGTRGYCRM
jgi:hypothetical protein